jgi:predicted esterase
MINGAAMKELQIERLFPVLFALALLAASGAAAEQDFEAGRLHERVASEGDPSQSFALYVPARTGGEKALPVLFLFDSGGRGALAVSRFREAADKYGWILAGSNDSRNGPSEPIVRAARTMWSEVRRRLPIDERRVHVAGFSGGARAASYFAKVTGAPVAGIIACGAGLSQGVKPADVKPAFWFGLVGFSDFNYREMKGLDAAFDGAGIGHRLLVFDGRHDWPESGLCARALGWLEVLAMKRDLLARDEALIDELLGTETGDAGTYEAAGRIVAAAGRIEAARSLLEGLRGTKDLEARLGILKARPEYSRELKAEAKREARETEAQSGFARVFAEIQAEAPGPIRFLEIQREIELHVLHAEAGKARRAEDRGLASRLLFDLCFNAESKALEYYEKKDLARTAVFLDLALEACEAGNPRAKILYYDLACVAALRGDTKKALKDLAAAVDKGFADVQTLESSKPLDVLRGTQEFLRILGSIKSRSARGPGGGR